MNILIRRMIFTDNSTIGELYINSEFICYTLEDTVRKEGEKIYGKTAIPKGTYKVAITMSNRFKKELPLLLNVPNFEGVRIHTGNNPEDTEGCILVGNTKDVDWIGQSKLAFDSLFHKMKQSKDITITITN